jgi:hypothetical protein
MRAFPAKYLCVEQWGSGCPTAPLLEVASLPPVVDGDEVTRPNLDLGRDPATNCGGSREDGPE